MWVVQPEKGSYHDASDVTDILTANRVQAWRPEAVPARSANLILVGNDDGLHFPIRFRNLRLPIVEIRSLCHDFASIEMYLLERGWLGSIMITTEHNTLFVTRCP